MDSLFVSVLLGMAISKHFKRILFGLEPEEIVRLFEERNATLETVREGIIVELDPTSISGE